MSSLSDSILTDLTNFGEAGLPFQLIKIHRDLVAYRMVAGHKSLKVPLSLGIKVANQIIGVLASFSGDSNVLSIAWCSLTILCERDNNACAYELLDELQSTIVLTFVARSLATILDGRTGTSGEYCLFFLSIFTQNNSARELQIGQVGGIIETILRCIDLKYNKVKTPSKIFLLRVLSSSLAANLHRSLANAECVLRNDGFRIVNKAFQSAYQWAQIVIKMRRMSDNNGIDILCTALSGLHSVLRAILLITQHKADGTMQLPPFLREQYVYSPEDLMKTTATLHSYFALTDDPSFKDKCIKLFFSFCTYVSRFHQEHLETVMLFTADTVPPSASSGVSFIVQFMRIARDPYLAHLTEGVHKLCTVSDLSPAVLALVMAEQQNFHPVPPDLAISVQRTHCCAYPKCFLTSVSFVAFQKCSRCKAVWYCGKEHQTLHWKEHKKECIAPV